MPQTWQEWLALGLVAFTAGILLGRWLNSRRAEGNQPESCHDCPSAKPKPQAFKNIPINLQNKTASDDNPENPA